jgi:hypothetical protein
MPALLPLLIQQFEEAVYYRGVCEHWKDAEKERFPALHLTRKSTVSEVKNQECLAQFMPGMFSCPPKKQVKQMWLRTCGDWTTLAWGSGSWPQGSSGA